MSGFTEIIPAMVAEGWDDRTTTKAAAEFERRVEALAQTGDPLAYARLQQWLHSGARADWVKYRKAQRQSWLAGPNGEVISTPARYATPAYEPNGTKSGEYQLQLIVVMTRPQVLAVLQQQQKQQQLAAASVAVLNYALYLLDRHPEAETVHDALLLEGVDPDMDWSEGAL